MRDPFYITTPIYYVNADPHVGHAYTTIMADIIARHHRQRGDDVFFLTGTDEHGSKIAEAAEKAGREPQDHADALSERFRALAGTVNASQDFFIRTTDGPHKAEVQRIVDQLHAGDHIYKAAYGGWYCTPCEAFYTEDELEADHACKIHGTPAVWTEEENWFFRLSAFRDQLLAWYESHPRWVLPRHRYNEAQKMIEMGLEDLSISRSRITWGIPLSWDAEQVLYVWVDALFNYWTALQYARPGEDLTGQYWPPTVQLLAKDILKFHAVIWPALCIAAELEMPKQLFIHGYVLKGGEKMSKTSGNVVDPFPFIEAYGIDALRYYLAREIRFGEDGTFTQEGFEQRYQSELANELGNLLNRTVSMIRRYRGGVVPQERPHRDEAVRNELLQPLGGVRRAVDEYDLTDMIEAVWKAVRFLNQLVEVRAPWKLAKDPLQGDALDEVLHTLAEGVRIVAILLWPVMPGSCEAILAQLGQPTEAVSLDLAEWGRGTGGATVGTPVPLFPRVEVAEPE